MNLSCAWLMLASARVCMCRWDLLQCSIEIQISQPVYQLVRVKITALKETGARIISRCVWHLLANSYCLTDFRWPDSWLIPECCALDSPSGQIRTSRRENKSTAKSIESKAILDLSFESLFLDHTSHSVCLLIMQFIFMNMTKWMRTRLATPLTLGVNYEWARPVGIWQP